jgi:hypothetical protein
MSKFVPPVSGNAEDISNRLEAVAADVALVLHVAWPLFSAEQQAALTSALIVINPDGTVNSSD